MVHEIRMYVMYVSSDVRLGLVLDRHPKINLFGLHYCVICCEVETKSGKCISRHLFSYGGLGWEMGFNMPSSFQGSL